MRVFLFSQTMFYLILVSPGSRIYGLGLFGFWFWCASKKPVWALLGATWEIYSLTHFHGQGFDGIYATAQARLRCDARYWFICSSSHSNVLIEYLAATRIGQGAEIIRNWIQERCLAWHALWGPLAYSLLMGGKAEDSIKSLYRNLGFIHVLVISGSQFSLLSIWLKKVLMLPFSTAYALGICNWKIFRQLNFLIEFLCCIGLLVYLLACGASPPCQRAFLQQTSLFVKKWWWPSSENDMPSAVAGIQSFLFPEDFFSLSNTLSWGAVQSLKLFGLVRTFFSQLRTSLCIQLMNLALFGRLSLSSILFDFFVAPFWDLLLFVCLLAIFIPELDLQMLLGASLDHFHEGLLTIDRWQGGLFGSSALSLRSVYQGWGRLAAGGAFMYCLLVFSNLSKSKGR